MPNQEEPSAWELQRRLDAHDRRLDSSVTRQEFEAEKRRQDDRHKDAADDIARETAERKEQLRGEREARKAGDAEQQLLIDKLVQNWKLIGLSLLLPIALAIVSIYFGTKGGS